MLIFLSSGRLHVEDNVLARRVSWCPQGTGHRVLREKGIQTFFFTPNWHGSGDTSGIIFSLH